MLDKMVDPRQIIFGIGLAQILDIYAHTSLDAQKLTNFPTTVLTSCQRLVEALEALGDSWKWDESELVMACIGVPSTLVKEICNGEYKPFVSHGSRRAAAIKIHLNRQATYEEDADVIYVKMSADDIVVSSIPILGASTEILNQIESNLQEICNDLVYSYNRRFKPSALMFEVHAAYGSAPPPPELQELSQKYIRKIVLPGPKQEFFSKSEEEITAGNQRFLG